MNQSRSDMPVASVSAATVRVPPWARGTVGDGVFAAGAALSGLHSVVTASPAWGGVWAQRLALRATAAACRHLGRTEDEIALRDLWQLRPTDGSIGPAGAILLAYHRLCGREPLRKGFAEAARAFSVEAAVAGELLAKVLTPGASGAPLAAASAAAAVIAGGSTDRARDLLALWVADAVLAEKLAWPFAVPLYSMGLVTGRRDATRPRPGDRDFVERGAVAVAVGAASACDLAADIARRAVRLEAAAMKVRTKQVGRVTEVLLKEDAVTAARLRGKLSDRAARRLFDRLVALGGVRELTGRTSFRIYGL